MIAFAAPTGLFSKENPLAKLGPSTTKRHFSGVKRMKQLIRAIFARLTAAALIGALPAHAALVAPVHAGTGFNGPDGIYAVNTTTRQGNCDRVYNWMILVSSGRVSAAGDSPLAATGQINSRGIVNLRFERFGQVATATGRVSGGSGSGTWIAPSLQCSGSWRAIRRGAAVQ
jgi:hypothetical protein